MRNFSFHNPTKIIFGKRSVEQLAAQLKQNNRCKKVFLTYGQGSIKKNGLYDDVMQQLAGFEVEEFGGIEPNPRVETLREGIVLQGNSIQTLSSL